MTAYEHDTRQALTRADGRAQPDADEALVAYLERELFEVRRQRSELRLLRDAVLRYDVDTMTPMEALTALYALRRAAQTGGAE